MFKNKVIVFSVICISILIAWIFFTGSDVGPIKGIAKEEILQKSSINSPFGKGNDVDVKTNLQSNLVVNKSFVTKSEQIDKLTESGSPNDAFKAFKIAQKCSVIRDFKYKGGDVTDAVVMEECGNITQVQIRNRINNLEKAVKAGISGSAAQYVAVGPIDGDLSAFETRRNDPLVVEWINKTVTLLEESAKKGDIDSLNILSNNYQVGAMTEKNPELALTYEFARQAINNYNKESVKAKSNENLTKLLSKSLTLEQIDAAKKAGQKIADVCCKK